MKKENEKFMEKISKIQKIIDIGIFLMCYVQGFLMLLFSGNINTKALGVCIILLGYLVGDKK
jgi:hypothetical protein